MEITGEVVDETLQLFVRIEVIMLVNHMFIHIIINNIKMQTENHIIARASKHIL